MKKTNKKGFTLVEIMIVVAIIGLLAAIGIPSILGAYSTSQENSKERNIAEVEKAKGVLTLPAGTVAGAKGYTEADTIQDQDILDILQVDAKSDLAVDGTAIDFGNWTNRASYSGS